MKGYRIIHPSDDGLIYSGYEIYTGLIFWGILCGAIGFIIGNWLW